MKNRLLKHSVLLLPLLGAVLSGCALPNSGPDLATHQRIDVIEDLSDQLLDKDFIHFEHDKKLAVTSALFVENLKPFPQKASSFSSISHYLQEGLISELARNGVNVIEIRLSKNIKLQDNYEQVLTRELAELKGSVLLDYYLTGTLSPRPTGVQANLRVVDIQTQQVLASASGFIPVDYFGPREQIEVKDGLLYRNATK